MVSSIPRSSSVVRWAWLSPRRSTTRTSGLDGSSQALLEGFQAALIVPVFAAAIGVVVVASGLIRIPIPNLRLDRSLSPRPAPVPVPVQRDTLLAPTNGDRMRVGIIGSGNVGATAAALLMNAGHEVALSNTRGPEFGFRPSQAWARMPGRQLPHRGGDVW